MTSFLISVWRHARTSHLVEAILTAVDDAVAGVIQVEAVAIETSTEAEGRIT